MSRKNNPKESNQKDIVKDGPEEEEVHESSGDNSDHKPAQDPNDDETETPKSSKNVVQQPIKKGAVKPAQTSKGKPIAKKDKKPSGKQQKQPTLTEKQQNPQKQQQVKFIQPPTSPKPNAPPEPAKKSNKVVIIIVAVVVYIALMTIAGGVVYVTYGSGSANVPLVTTPRPTQIFANPNLPNPNLPNANLPDQNLPNQNLPNLNLQATNPQPPITQPSYIGQQQTNEASPNQNSQQSAEPNQNSQGTNPQPPIITQPGNPGWPVNQPPVPQSIPDTTQNASPTRAPATTITQLGTAITQCPTIYAACPEVSGCRPVSCVPQPTTCVPRSTTPCAPMASCPNGQCRPPCTAPTRQPDPPFSEFETNRAGRWQSKSVAEWINMFAPYSRERLNVVITLLDETVEKWAYAGFAHRCAPSSVKSPYLIHNTKCTFCNDRYSYIKCVMSGEVAGPINPYGQTHLFFDDNALRNARHNIPYILWNSVSQVINLVTHFVNIEKAIQPFQVKRADGIECRVCADFNRKVYDRCISHDRVYEGP